MRRSRSTSCSTTRESCRLRQHGWWASLESGDVLFEKYSIGWQCMGNSVLTYEWVAYSEEGLLVGSWQVVASGYQQKSIGNELNSSSSWSERAMGLMAKITVGFEGHFYHELFGVAIRHGPRVVCQFLSGQKRYAIHNWRARRTLTSSRSFFYGARDWAPWRGTATFHKNNWLQGGIMQMVMRGTSTLSSSCFSGCSEVDVIGHFLRCWTNRAWLTTSTKLFLLFFEDWTVHLQRPQRKRQVLAPVSRFLDINC